MTESNSVSNHTFFYACSFGHVYRRGMFCFCCGKSPEVVKSTLLCFEQCKSVMSTSRIYLVLRHFYVQRNQHAVCFSSVESEERSSFTLHCCSLLHQEQFVATRIGQCGIPPQMTPPKQHPSVFRNTMARLPVVKVQFPRRTRKITLCSTTEQSCQVIRRGQAPPVLLL